MYPNKIPTGFGTLVVFILHIFIKINVSNMHLILCAKNKYIFSLSIFFKIIYIVLVLVPIWYFYEKGVFSVLGRPNNKWISNIYKNPKVSACIDSPNPPYARVTFKADAEVADREWFGEWEYLAHRYLGEENGHKCYEETKDVPRVLITIHPSKLISWNGGGWHPRYK